MVGRVQRRAKRTWHNDLACNFYPIDKPRLLRRRTMAISLAEGGSAWERPALQVRLPRKFAPPPRGCGFGSFRGERVDREGSRKEVEGSV
jgi:hypothetical protein